MQISYSGPGLSHEMKGLFPATNYFCRIQVSVNKHGPARNTLRVEPDQLSAPNCLKALQSTLTSHQKFGALFLDDNYGDFNGELKKVSTRSKRQILNLHISMF